MSSNTQKGFENIALDFLDENFEFKPVATYDEDGDCVEFLAKPDDFYAERIDDLVTVYYSQETNEIVGSLIKGVSRYFQKLINSNFPGFVVEIDDGLVTLSHLFLARMWERNLEGQQKHIYKILQREAEHANIRTPISKVS